MEGQMTPSELDAAQRVIESDSFLRDMFLKTPVNLPFRERISEVFKSQISHNQEELAEFNRIKQELETKNALYEDRRTE
jgi:hypothetical protein